MKLHYPNGERVHCGVVLYVRIKGEWKFARHEYTCDGESYFVYDGEKAINAEDVQVDFTKRIPY